MRTINFSEARNNLKDVFDRVLDDDDITIITRRDAGDVVVMSLDAYNSWRETMYLMSSPANAQRLNESIAQARAGGASELREVEEGLGSLDDVEAGVLVDLLLSYRAVSSWDEMVRLVEAMPEPLQRTVLVRQQYGFALNRAKRRADCSSPEPSPLPDSSAPTPRSTRPTSISVTGM